MKDERYLAVDLTHILSMSEGVISATLGHNSKNEYLPQVRLLLLFSIGRDTPAYFRILPGAINSVASLHVTVEESGVSDVVFVADTGFYSSTNVKELDGMGIFFIIPLKRNSKLIDYSTEQGRHLMFQAHPIFYSRYKSNGRSMLTFLNDFLKAEEEKDMLRRYSPEGVIEHLERVSMLKIGDEWKISEIPKKSRDIIDELGIPIMQKSGS